MPGGDAVHLEIPGALDLIGDWVLHAQAPVRVMDRREDIFHNANPYEAWLDARLVGGQLIVRTRLPGDRFLPMGMGGHSMKISDLMVNAKIPRHARRNWPLVCSDAGIVWVPGYRAGELARVLTDTKWVIKLSVYLIPE
jgi:tRNA(Ile)-lysidine synthase